MFDEYTKTSRAPSKGKHGQRRGNSNVAYKADSKGSRKTDRRQEQQFTKRVEKELQYA